MTSGNVYEISVQLLRDRDGQVPQEPRVLRFEHTNHDDLFEIVARMQQGTGLGTNAATTAAVGLKLLAEVMLRERRNPLFDALRNGMRDFIRGLKARLADPPPARAVQSTDTGLPHRRVDSEDAL